VTRQRRVTEPRGTLHAMRRPPTIVAAITLSGLALMSGCTSADGKTSQPTTKPSAATTETTTSSPSTTSSTLSPAERDARAAQAAVVALRAMTDALAINPHMKLERLATVARSQALAQWRTTLFTQRVKGWKQIGNVTVVSSTAKRKSNSQRFEVTACVDVSKVSVVDRNGKSVVAANRPPRTRDTYIAQRTEQGWFVVGEKFEVTTC
jgi:hypothetical protein